MCDLHINIFISLDHMDESKLRADLQVDRSTDHFNSMNKTYAVIISPGTKALKASISCRTP